MRMIGIFAALLLVATTIIPVSATTTPVSAKEQSSQFDFEPTPAIWKLADEDTTIYMFGTIHLLPRDLKWRTDKFDAIVKEVDELVVETSDADSKVIENRDEFFASMTETKDVIPLIERIKPENQTALRSLAKYIGLPLEALDVVPAWIIPFMMYFKSIEGAETSGEYGHKYGVETVLEAEFAKMEKPVVSIEDPLSIVAALTNMPEGQQMAFINQMLEEWDVTEDALKTVEFDPLADIKNKSKSTDNPVVALDYTEDIAWAKGNIAKLEVGLTKEEMGEGYYDILITDRNTAWTIWLEERLKRPGKILLAVGAGHFVGEHALLKMLAAKGLEVERIQ